LDIAMTIDIWNHFVTKEMAIYHTLNMFNFDRSRHTLIGEGWCPKDQIETVRTKLVEASKRSGASLESVLSVLKKGKQIPPTYFKTNKFTKVFQKNSRFLRCSALS